MTRDWSEQHIIELIKRVGCNNIDLSLPYFSLNGYHNPLQAKDVLDKYGYISRRVEGDILWQVNHTSTPNIIFKYAKHMRGGCYLPPKKSSTNKPNFITSFLGDIAKGFHFYNKEKASPLNIISEGKIYVTPEINIEQLCNFYYKKLLDELKIPYKEILNPDLYKNGVLVGHLTSWTGFMIEECTIINKKTGIADGFNIGQVIVIVDEGVEHCYLESFEESTKVKHIPLTEYVKQFKELYEVVI